MKQFTKTQALKFYHSKVWKNWTAEQITIFQLHQNRLCVPFSVFHEAIEKTLKRPVFTHELAFPEHLKLELAGIKKKPTFEEILNLIPNDKTVLLLIEKEERP